MTSKSPSQFQQFDSSQYDRGESHESGTATPAQVDFQSVYRDAPYYSAGRSWDDYAPAYRYGEDSQRKHAGKRFDELEAELSRNWESARDASRLGWVEARGAVEDAWHASEAIAMQGGHGDDGGQQVG